MRTAPDLSQQVYQQILDEICDGRLEPGAHLVQEQLATRFDVSRQPIQQAMALLKADGLVEEVGRRGLYVTALDLTLMQHHYSIRAALDGLAARSAALRVANDQSFSAQARDQGQQILNAGSAAVASGKVREQIHHDEAFHKCIYTLSGNPLLTKTAESHWRYLRRVMADVLRHAEPASTIWQQHARILETIVAGDTHRAEQLAVEHIHHAMASLSDVFTQQAAAHIVIDASSSRSRIRS